MILDSIVSLEGVGFSYSDDKRPALADVSLQVQQGQWLALVGSNGSGKSTLAKHLNALLVPTQGACFVYGLDTKDEANLWDIRTRVSLVFQNPENQIVSTIVEDDVAFGPENLGLTPEEIQGRVVWALDKVGLLDRARDAVYSLSGGQKQRLAIAGALAMRSGCIVLDEPTAMLDPQGRFEVMELLGQLHREGITIVQVTHHLSEIIEADRVVVLDKGRVVWDGSPVDLFKVRDLRERFGLEVPAVVLLWDELVAGGFIPFDTGYDVDEMVGNLWESGSRI